MKRCTACNQLIAFGAYRDGEQSFCSLPCLTASPLGTFCESCIDQTIDETPGNTFLVSAIGSRLMGSDKRCPACHSVEQREWFWLIFPLIPLQRYRCIYFTQTKYVGRRVAAPDVAPDSEASA
jgi:hypothetical protein